MDIKEIQSFIDDTIYDFGTVEYSLECGRIKETFAIMRQILARIQKFRGTMNKGHGAFNNIFQETFWDKDLLGNLKTGDLEDLEYQRFIGRARSLAYDNIYQLRQIIKSPMQKKMESVFIVLSACVLGLCLASIVISRIFFQDWGLQGDFYQGQDFENHLATANNKTINFSNNLEMNQRMPYEHSSARWQGFLIVPRDGSYTFFMKVDDGARLFIDGQLLIDAWKDNDSAQYTQKINLSKGEHPIRLDYYNDLYNSVLKLYWAFKGGEKKIIPARYLRTKRART